MKLAENLFKRAIKEGQSQVGLWISLGSPVVAELVSHSGFDWALIDMEHSPNDYFSVLSQLQAFEASGTTPLVRPEWNDPVVVKRLLDLGVPGLLFPMIQSVDEAEKAVAATRYPPRGVRGSAGTTRATGYGRIKDYFSKAEDEIAVLLQLESVSAMEKATEIAAVDGVDGIFFGPADIAADMGKPGQPMDREVWKLIRETSAKLAGMNVPCGTLVLDPQFAAELLNEEFTFVACGLDASLLARSSDALAANVRGKLKS